MLNKLFQQVLSVRSLELPALGLLLTVGVAAAGSTPILASAVKTPATQSQVGASNNNTLVSAQRPASNTSMSDGVYLYGQASQPEQIGKEYVIFEARNGKVSGALYMPASEFSCFQGTIDKQQLNVTMVDPEDNTAYSHSIPLEQKTQVAAAGGRLEAPNMLGLQGYHAIDKVSDNDQRILTACKNNAQ